MRHYKRILFGATGLMAASLTLASLGLGATAASATGNGRGNGNGGNQPPGNNGTVKIDEYPVDSGHDNDPHVTCPFAVTFWGYDGGTTQNATINITPVAPTSGGQTYTTTTSWKVDSRTGGSQYDQTVEVTAADLAPALNGVTPQAQQGYHLRLEVEVTGSQGSDDKYKVFWMQPCTSESGSSGSTSGATTTTTSTTSTTSTTVAIGSGSNEGSGGTTVPTLSTTPASVASSGSSNSSNSGSSSDSVKSATLASGSQGTSATPTAGSADAAAVTGSAAGPFGVLSGDQSAAVPTSSDQPSSGSLAFTGASVGALVVLGLGLIAVGLLLTRRWRRATA